MRRLWFILLPLCLAARAESPEIISISPRAIAPGQSTVLTLRGSNLGEATNLWTSFGGGARLLTHSSQAVSFRVECPPDAFGIEAIQAHGPDGISDFALVLIDSLPLAKSGSRLEPPSAIDHSFKSEEVDYYTFPAKAGQELSIEALAHRIGSEADPVLRVLDAERRELAYCDDDDSVWRDARLRFRAPAAGDYTLAVHDVGYGGGKAFFYRLRIGDFPIAWTQFPLADWTEPGTGAGVVALPNDSPANPERTVWFGPAPMLVEREPNDRAADAPEFGLPAVLNGRFQSGADRDLYRFAADRKQRLSFLRQSRSLGSPCDVALRILKPDGSLVAESDHRTLDDVPFTHRFAEAGPYLLEVRELTGTAPAQAAYRVKVQEWTPWFELATEIDKLEIENGQTGKLNVTCERFDYEGEIVLEAPEIEFAENVIPPGKKEIEVQVKLPTGEAFRHFRIVGKGTNGFQTFVSTRPALRKTFPLMLQPPPRLDGWIAAGAKR